jgi:hypothetical protein
MTLLVSQRIHTLLSVLDYFQIRASGDLTDDVSDQDFISPFMNPDSSNIASFAENSPETTEKEMGMMTQLQDFGSRIQSSMSRMLPRLSARDRMSSLPLNLNIGRVALPAKTADGIAGSLYTSMILPEPSRVSWLSESDNQSHDVAHMSRRDVRQLSLETLASQDTLRRSLILMDPHESVQRGMVPGGSLCAHPLNGFQGHLSRSFVDAIHRSIVFDDNKSADDAGTDSNKEKATSKSGLSEASDTAGLGNTVNDLTIDETKIRSASIKSPFLEETFDEMDSISWNERDSGKMAGSSPAHLTMTKSGRVLQSGREVGLDALIGRVVDEMKLSSSGRSSSAQESPVLDMQGGELLSALSVLGMNSFNGNLSGSRHEYGGTILRSMSMSFRENLSLQGQEVIDLQRRLIPRSIIMGRNATNVLGRRVANQPGSLVLSSIFTQLSQMQPSLLQKQGLILPVIPDDVFEHTIAAKPSFEFRVLPDKTIIFFVINASILLGVIAGGILSIFINAG